MHQIQEGEEKKGNPGIKKITIIQQAPGIPDDRKGRGGYDNRGPIGQTVEQVIIVPAENEHYGEYQNPENYGSVFN